jgi:hypothetical protein
VVSSHSVSPSLYATAQDEVVHGFTDVLCLNFLACNEAELIIRELKLDERAHLGAICVQIPSLTGLSLRVDW